MGSLRYLMPAAALAVLLGGCASGPDPTQMRLDNLDTRVSRIERFVSNGSLVQLAQQQSSLQAQIRQLQGQVDELQRTNSQLEKEQRQEYADLEKRIAAAGQGGAAGGDSQSSNAGGAGAAGSSGAPGAAGAPAGTSGANDASQLAALPGVSSTQQSIYGQAFDALKAGSYSVAISGFEGFVKSYPTSPLAPNAEYWLGEAHFVNQDYPQAERAFRAVLSRWPDSGKARDAMLDLGNVLLAQGKTSEGRKTLRKVVKQFPGTGAATQAEKLLQQKSG